MDSEQESDAGLVQEAFVRMPEFPEPAMLRAVRMHATTACDDKDEEHRRIGWLICAYDVMVKVRTGQIVFNTLGGLDEIW